MNNFKLDSKENIKKFIRRLYLRVIIFHNNRHDLSYVNSKEFDNILEIIYLIIEDVCYNERIDITSIESAGCGAYSSVLIIGNKVIKIGCSRETKRFPNNPYINTMLLRKEFPITEQDSLFVEVSERVDTNTKVEEEELYQLYKKVRDLGLVWLDIGIKNIGRLLRDNKVHWRFELPITDEVLGLDSFRGKDLLKKGDIVIVDNDLIYDINNHIIPFRFATPYLYLFETRYEKEEKSSPHYGGKLIIKREKTS